MTPGGNYWTLFTPGIRKVLHAVFHNEAAADNDRAPRRLSEVHSRVVVHPSQEFRATFDPFSDRPHIRDRPHLENPRQIDAGNGRAKRWRARR